MKNPAPTQRQQQILEAMLPHVPFDGWSVACLERAAADAGLTLTLQEKQPDLYVELLCDGLIDAMNRQLASQELTSLRLSEKVETAVMALLEAALPHREALRKAVAHDALPQHAAGGSARLYRTVDAIWKAVGDHPTDFSYYTKRLSLAGIYGATLLFWLSDESESQEDTRQFLRRRMQDLFAFHRTKSRLKEQMGGLARRMHEARAGIPFFFP